jgi:hypothetical protein
MESKLKLYTEEQVMKAYNLGIDDGHNGAISLQINELSLTPIELPSDEEIEKKLYPFNDDFVCGYIAAIEMIEEQIKQQGNETLHNTTD